jgi:hypothetical protein
MTSLLPRKGGTTLAPNTPPALFWSSHGSYWWTQALPAAEPGAQGPDTNGSLRNIHSRQPSRLRSEQTDAQTHNARSPPFIDAWPLVLFPLRRGCLSSLPSLPWALPPLKHCVTYTRKRPPPLQQRTLAWPTKSVPQVCNVCSAPCPEVQPPT